MARVTIDNWTDENVWDAVHTANEGTFRIEESDEGDCHVIEVATGKEIAVRNSLYQAMSAISYYLDQPAAVREP